MTVSASANVVIGGIPMPSLTNMAIGAAMKFVFKGLGKLFIGIRNFSRAASRAAEEEAAAAARAAEREALIARTGQPSETFTQRASEVPYRNPPEMYKIPPNPPASLDPSKTYLWVVDSEGNVLIAPERQDGFGRVVKHGDLTPGLDGATRGPARAGGELNFNPETGHWEMKQRVKLHVRPQGRRTRYCRQPGSVSRADGTWRHGYVKYRLQNSHGTP